MTGRRAAARTALRYKEVVALWVTIALVALLLVAL